MIPYALLMIVLPALVACMTIILAIEFSPVDKYQ